MTQVTREDCLIRVREDCLIRVREDCLIRVLWRVLHMIFQRFCWRVACACCDTSFSASFVRLCACVCGLWCVVCGVDGYVGGCGCGRKCVSWGALVFASVPTPTRPHPHVHKLTPRHTPWVGVGVGVWAWVCVVG